MVSTTDVDMKRREFLKLGVTACAAATPIGMAVVGGLRQSFPHTPELFLLRGSIHVRFVRSETVFKFGGAVNKNNSIHKSPFIKLSSR